MAKPKDKKKPSKKQAEVVEQPVLDQQQDIEARRTRLKALIMLGKERGYLTYAEINDHLPDMLEVEQIEGVVSMINEMGVSVCDVAPDAETLIMSDAAPAGAEKVSGGGGGGGRGRSPKRKKRRKKKRGGPQGVLPRRPRQPIWHC